MFRDSRAFTLFVALLLFNGCATVVYQELNRDLQNAAIDENDPIKTTLWSYGWQKAFTEWRPRAQGADLPLCYNKGAGRVEVRYTWYSVLMAMATVGFAVPMEMKVYCFADPRVTVFADPRVAVEDSLHMGP